MIMTQWQREIINKPRDPDIPNQPIAVHKKKYKKFEFNAIQVKEHTALTSTIASTNQNLS